MPQVFTTFSSTTARFVQLNGVNHCEPHTKVMWEQAKITEDSDEPSGECSSEKNIKAMNAYSKALQAGDMKNCLPVLVSLSFLDVVSYSTQDPSYTFSGFSKIPVPRADIHSFFKEFRQQVIYRIFISNKVEMSCHAFIRLKKLEARLHPLRSFSG